MKISEKFPSHLPVLHEDIVSAYSQALSEYDCDENSDKCASGENRCVCEFRESLWQFDVPPMSRSEFYAFADIVDISESDAETFYRSYVHNWANEQDMEKSLNLLRRKNSVTGDRRAEIWREWQSFEESTRNYAEEILARDGNAS